MIFLSSELRHMNHLSGEVLAVDFASLLFFRRITTHELRITECRQG